MQSSHIMVIMIVLIVMIASVFRAKYSHGRRGAPGQAIDSAETKQLREEVKQLRERIQVLERITVEKENSLERQIEALRDR